MLDLKDITLIAYTSVKLEKTVAALEYSSKDINFGCIKLVSDIKPNNLPSKITHSYTKKISNIDEWNYAMVYDLGNHVDTKYAILIHDNGFIVNPSSWREEFLDYDYIGAPWPLPTDNFSYRDINGNIIRAGNSVSLRSKRLMDLPSKIKMEWKPFHGYYNEDGFIAVNNRHIFIEHEMKFGDLDVAKYFSHETELPETKNITPFAFHNYSGENRKYLNLV
jgi:hypothetical protein